MDACNNILYLIYILLATTIISIILIGMLRNNRNNSRYRSSLFIFYGIILYHVFYGEKYNGIITSLIILFIFVYVLYAFGHEEINLMAIYRSIKLTSITLLIILICCLAAKLIVYKFNDDSWWINENNISDSIDKWGDFATFFGGIFALISIFLAYKAFMSQANASKRTSFDTTFTQIFAQHHVLHDKVLKHDIAFISRYDLSYVVNDINSNIFAICKNEYGKIVTGILPINVVRFWYDFNQLSIQESVSIDFKNYFKYIYHEINIVVNQPDEVLNDNSKRNYIQLIQAQMNYDELFCYFINQVEYLSYWRTHSTINEATYNEAITHAANLRSYGFFYELCKSRSGHVNLVRDISRYNNEEVSRLIDVNWIS